MNYDPSVVKLLNAIYIILKNPVGSVMRPFLCDDTFGVEKYSKLQY